MPAPERQRENWIDRGICPDCIHDMFTVADGQCCPECGFFTVTKPTFGG